MTLFEIPRYSRVRIEGFEVNGKLKEEFNFYYIESLDAVCETDNNENFLLPATTEAEFVCSMKEHDLKNLNK